MAERVHAAVVPYRDTTDPIRMAVAGYLAGYSLVTRQAYSLDLRARATWCDQHHLELFSVRRAHIELFARDQEAQGKARSTIARRLSTIAGFYRYANELSTDKNTRKALDSIRDPELRKLVTTPN